MSRPSHVWPLFVLFLAFAVAGLFWLTRQTLELDRAESAARRQAEQEERIGLALWRMDAFLMPLVVQEASRPDFTYAASYWIADPSSGKSGRRRMLSPLLESPPEFVRLHFQLAPDGRLSSPQAPSGRERDWTFEQGVAVDRVIAAADRLRTLGDRLTYPQLVALLPPTDATTFVDVGTANQIAANNYSFLPPVVESFASQQLANSPSPFDPFGAPAAPVPSPSQSLPPSQSSPLPSFDAPPRQPDAAGASNVAASAASAARQQSPPPVGASTDRNATDGGPYAQPAPSINGLDQRRQQAVPGQRPAYNDPVNINDLANRNSVLQAFASKANVDGYNQRSLNLVESSFSVEGTSRPIWIDSELLLARRVERDGATIVQGCWIDWPKLRERLQQEVADVLPGVELLPAGMSDASRSLATLPVKLVAPPPDDRSSGSPIRMALALAWSGLAIAAGAAAVTLASVLKLSERRAAFVAAVTHELRTPLTTFRMYAEMLAGGMVPADRQNSYLETLHAEADRLAHLVDNVLQYARLERGRTARPRETLELRALVERVVSRLASRAEQAELRLETILADDDGAARLTVDAGAVEQIVFNLVDNACKYAAHGDDRRLHLEVVRSGREALWRVRDHGPGVPANARKRLFQPFSKTVQEAAITAPGVGLGLALSRRLAGELGGSLRLESSGPDGSVFTLALPLDGR